MGVICNVTVTFRVCIDAHCPADEVNVYVVCPAFDVLIVAGLQVPLIEFVDANGSAGAVLFWQSGPTCANTGATWFVITISIVAVVAHWPAVGVNV